MNATIVGAVWRQTGLAYFLGSIGGGIAQAAAGVAAFGLVLIGLIALVAILLLAFSGHSQAAGDLLLAVGPGAAVAPSANRPNVNWGRKREPSKQFQNVAAGADATHPQTAFTVIPRYPRTVNGLILNLGGTSFLKSDITRIEVFAGTKSIWGPVTGSELALIRRYELGDNDNDANFLPVMFTSSTIKEIGGEFIGGLDMTQFPDGTEVRMEVDIASSANAPTLASETVWGPPKGNAKFGNLFLKLIKRNYAQLAAGDQPVDVAIKGAIALRHFIKYTVALAAVATARGIGGGANTGNGVMGAITVAAGTPCGRYRLAIVAPAANAGTFALWDPNGKLVDLGTVAVAFNSGGLAFTLADGAADWVAGDGFTIDVMPRTATGAGNLTRVQVRKNEDVWWDYTDVRARFEQQRYGRTPMDRLYVVDFLQDNHIDSIMDTADATALDYILTFTAADTPTIISQVLVDPKAS